MFLQRGFDSDLPGNCPNRAGIVADEFDLLILGSGPGGYVAAIRASQWGLRTAVIEKDDRLGGTCLNVGCIPTKALLFSAEVYDYVRNAKDYGIECADPKLQFEAVRARQKRIVTKHVKGVEFLFRKNKVETIRGYGKLLGGGRVSVQGPDGERQLQARNIILATGSEARMLPGLAPDGERILTNKEILATPAMPKTILIVGAGAVGVEFASIYRRFGADVTMVEMLPRILPLSDEEISKELEKSLKKQGIRILTGTRVDKVEKRSDGVDVSITQGEASQKLSADQVLIAVGRKPNTDNVGLEKTKAQVERGLVKTDAYMQTAEPGLYAIGDIVAGAQQLAHAASMEGIIAVGKIAGKDVPAMNYHHVPECIYCEPQVAGVGLTEAQAREQGYKVKIGKFPFSASGKATIIGAHEGFIKLVCEERYGEILGAHMMGPSVTELIAEVVAAMRLEATAEDLMYTVHAHPTLYEAVMDAANAVYSLTINA